MNTEPDVAGRLRPAAGAFPPHKPHEGLAGAQRCPCPQPAERVWGGKAPRTGLPIPPRARLPHQLIREPRSRQSWPQKGTIVRRFRNARVHATRL